MTCSGYLVFPQKMLATHHFAADPFSDRRVISSLGGSYILQAFVIAATSLSNIGMADRTLGLILDFFALTRPWSWVWAFSVDELR